MSNADKWTLVIQVWNKKKQDKGTAEIAKS